MAADPSFLMQLAGTGGLAGNNFLNAYNQAHQQAQQDHLFQQQQAAQQQAQMAAQQRQQAIMAAQQAYTSAPTHENLVKLAVAAPEHAEALYKGASMLDADTKQSQMTINGQLFNLAADGDPQQLASHVSQLIEAEKQSGNVDTSNAQNILDNLNSGDPARIAQARKAVTAEARLNLSVLGAKGFQIDPTAAGDKGDEFTNTPQGIIYSKRTGIAKGGGPASSGVPATISDVGTIWSNMVKTEGGINPDGSFRTSPKGAFGPAQLMPSTLPEAAQLAGVDPALARTDPNANLAAGQAYFQKQLSDFGDPSLAAAAYNAGPGAVRAAQAKAAKTGGDWQQYVPAETQKYVQSATGRTPPAAAPVDPNLLDKDTISLMAQQYLAGDKTVFQNLGRGKQGSANIVALRKEVASQAKSQGLQGADLAATMAQYQGDVAAERTAGNRMAQVELAANEAKRLAPIALRTSGLLDRVGWLPVAKVQQAIRNGSNNPQYRAFNAANNALVNAYSRAVSPTGVATDSQRQHAYDLLNTAFNQQSYNATVSQMMQEIDAALAAPRDVRQGLHNAISGHGDASGAPSSTQLPARTATNPATGQKLGLIGGKWVPLK